MLVNIAGRIVFINRFASMFENEKQSTPPHHLTLTQAEMLDDVEHLDGLVERSRLGLLVDDEIDVDVGVDEITVRRSAHRAFDAHQAMF